MKKQKLSVLAMAMALGGLAGVGQIASAHADTNAKVETLATAKSSKPKQRDTKAKIVNEIGGIPLENYVPNYGMSPKEYGQRFGNGGSKKRNRLRYSHNAKLKRRLSK